MIILGIDPGSIKLGYAFIELKGKKIHYLSSGTLKFSQKTEFLLRIKEIKFKIAELAKHYIIDELALESLIYVKSPTALMKLSQTRGVVISELIESVDDKVFEYSPNLVKSTIVGHGHADKLSVQKYLSMYVGNCNRNLSCS